jgi:hypothetical protein
MTDPPGPSHFRALFEAALQDYEKQTGVTLAKHPLAGQLENRKSVESVTSACADLGQSIGLVCQKALMDSMFLTPTFILYSFPPASAIHPGRAIFLSVRDIQGNQAVKDVGASYDALVDLFKTLSRSNIS